MEWQMIAGKKTLLSLEFNGTIYYTDEDSVIGETPRAIGRVCILKGAHQRDQEALKITIDKLMHQGNNSYYHQEEVHRVWYDVDCNINALSEEAMDAEKYFENKLSTVEETLYVVRKASKKEVG